MFEARKTSIGLTIAAIALQVAATIYFLIDALGESGSGGIGLFEMLVAVALLAGIAYGALTVRRLLAEADRREQALALARGALSELIRQRFAQWSLSRAEAEVALFALKGCSIAEIAHLRGAASGTVRSQLSQVYAKAGVNGQPMLMSLFLDDLLDPDALATG